MEPGTARTFHEGHRRAQTLYADPVRAERIVNAMPDTTSLSAEQSAFLEALPFFFLATSDGAGRMQCNFKGGGPGILRVSDPRTLYYPEYPGNDMMLSVGNLLLYPYVGILGICFQTRRRLKVNGHVDVITPGQTPDAEFWPEARVIIRVRIEEPMRLYDKELSGNCYKIRLMLGFLGLEYESVPIDTEKREQKRPEFLKFNSRGQILVLQDDDIVLWDPQAILVYLASRYGADRWFPMNPVAMGKIQQWLALSGNEIQYGLAKARAIKVFGRTGNIQEFKVVGKVTLDVMERRLADNHWLALATPTIADVACYPYVKYAPQGEMPLREYPAINAWLARFEQLPGYVRIDEIQSGKSRQPVSAAMER